MEFCIREKAEITTVSSIAILAHPNLFGTKGLEVVIVN
jgi:hypothetical protein